MRQVLLGMNSKLDGDARGRPMWLKFRRSARALCLALLLVFARPPQILGQELRLDAIPTGLRPLGVDLLRIHWRHTARVYGVVANSGHDSVSVFLVLNFRSTFESDPITDYRAELLTTVRGISAPYAVASCVGTDGLSLGVGDRVLVTSPTDNSVTVVRVPEGTIPGKISVGPQPHAVACFQDTTGAYKGVVSNVGDDSLVVFDVNSLRVESRISGVAGSRGLHGISIQQGGQAWVAGTQADIVTLVDLATSRVLTRIPVRGPTSVRGRCVASASDNLINCYDESLRSTSVFSPPSPQDFVGSPPNEMWFASTGVNSSVAFLVTRQLQGQVTRQEGVIPGVPGAAGMARYDLSGFFVVVTSPDSNRLFLIQRAAPAPQEFSIANGASFESTAAPNSVASLFATTGASQSFVVSLPLPKTLGGVSVRVGGSLNYDAASNRWNYSPTGSIEAPLWFVGPSQINFQIPPEVSPNESVPVQLRRPDGTTLLSTLRVTAAAPGIFSLLANGRGQAAALNQDDSLNGNAESILGARAAGRGSVIQIFATGAGATNPPLLAGEPAPASGNPLVFTQVQPTVTIGGRPARVLFSGMAPGYVGLWQINAEVPMDVTPGPAVSLVITAAGVQSNTVTIAVQ